MNCLPGVRIRTHSLTEVCSTKQRSLHKSYGGSAVHLNSICRLGVLTALTLFVLAAPQGLLATLPTPNQPILIVQDSSSTDPYQNFVPELLKTEGLNGFQTAQLSDLTASFLTNYDVVILPHLTLTAAQSTLFQNYVNAGGKLV